MSEPPKTYFVRITTAARRDLRNLHGGVLRRLDEKILSLRDEPRPPGCKKLQGADDLYRVRVGEYRIIYSISDEAKLVVIARVRHRRESY